MGIPSSPGDGKITPTFKGQITIDDLGDADPTNDMIAGSFVIGPGARLVSAGNRDVGAGEMEKTIGSKTIIEEWTSVTHTLAPTTVDSASGPNADGGFDYVFGSAGFPPSLCTGTGSGGVGDCFASEKGSESGEDPLLSPWIIENGGTGFNWDGSTPPGTGLEIVRFGLAFPPMLQNPGGATTAVIAGLTCSDTGLDPKIPGEPADTLTDCQDSAVAWGVTDPEGTDMGKLNAGIDNLILMLATDAAGNIVSADAYYTMEYPIIQVDDNSFVGGTLNFIGTTTCLAGDDPFGVIDDLTGTSFTLDVLANDVCVDPPLTIFEDVGAGDLMPDQGGTATTDGAIVTYTPPGVGAVVDPEEFTYTLRDNIVPNQDTGTVTIMLFDDLMPAANDLMAETTLDTPVVIDVSTGGNSLGNTETVVNSPGMLVVTTTPPMLGTVSIDGANVTYTPDPGLRGDDVFEYTITDSNGDVAPTPPTVALITVRIGAKPNAPDFDVPGKIAINDSVDIDLDAIPGAEQGDPPVIISQTQGLEGTTTLNGTTVTYQHTGACSRVDPDSFTYTFEDADMETDTGIISVTINCVPIANPAAAPNIDTTGVAPDSQSSSVDVSAIANNDLGDEPTAVTVTDGASGMTSLDVNTNIVTYTPNSDFFTGIDSYTYTLTDVD